MWDVLSNLEHREKKQRSVAGRDQRHLISELLYTEGQIRSYGARVQQVFD